MGLAGLDYGLAPSVSQQTLEKDYRLLLRKRGSISLIEIYSIEQRLARTRRPIPRSAAPAVLLAGSLAMKIPSLLRNSTSSAQGGGTNTTLFSLALSGVAAIMLGTSFIEDPFGKYVAALKRVNFTPLGPGGSAGATLGGRF